MSAPKAPVVTVVTDGSRLDALLGVYADVKAAADDAAAQLKVVTDGIKSELSLAHPDAPAVDVRHPLLATPLRLSYVERWTVDTTRLKTEDPETYVRFARKGGTWQLRGIKA